jgi:hypothetical protein
MTTEPTTPPAGASDAAIAQAFRNPPEMNSEQAILWQKIRRNAAEIEALTSKAEGDPEMCNCGYVRGSIACGDGTSDECKDSATPPAPVAGSGMGDADIAQAEDWIRSLSPRYSDPDAHRHSETILEALAAYDPSQVGARTTILTAQPAPVVGGDAQDGQRKAIGNLRKIVARWDSETFSAIGYDASQDRRVIRECLKLAEQLFNDRANQPATAAALSARRAVEGQPPVEADAAYWKEQHAALLRAQEPDRRDAARYRMWRDIPSLGMCLGHWLKPEQIDFEVDSAINSRI